jgi:solute carrier family 10 (sodium/bile acid cotransporter), member 7
MAVVESNTENIEHIDNNQVNEKTNSKTKEIAKKVWDYLYSQWFFFVLAILIIIARWWPQFAKDDGLIKGQYSLGYLMPAIIFFKSGSDIPFADIKKNMIKWRQHIISQSFSFLISSSIAYGFCLAIIKSNNKNIDKWTLAGIIVSMSCPTTIASNIVMSRKSNANFSLTICSTVLGNSLGAFISPAVVQMFMKGEFDFANPANNSSGVTGVYRRVMKQIGCCLFVPFFIGQMVRIWYLPQIQWFWKTFRLTKLGSVCLLMIMFNSFSTAFAQHAFTSVSHINIIFLCFFNVGLYLFLSLLTFFLVRPYIILMILKMNSKEIAIFKRKRIFEVEEIKETEEYKNANFLTKFKLANEGLTLKHFIANFWFDKKDTVSLLLCTSAKTAALGVAIMTSEYGADKERIGQLLVPLVLYQSEQVIVANFQTTFFKRWISKGDGDEEFAERYIEEREERAQLVNEKRSVTSDSSN